MLKAIKAMENYVNENFEEKIHLSKDDMNFLRTTVTEIREEFQKAEKEVTDAQVKAKASITAMQQRVTDAETREKAQVERQKQFGISQTMVETERHKNIMEELKYLGDHDIKVFNRSSYPFLPRHDRKKFFKKGKDGKKPIASPPHQDKTVQTSQRPQ